jgi:hypothetical protein
MVTASHNWAFPNGLLKLSEASGKTVHSKVYDLGEAISIQTNGKAYTLDGADKPLKNRAKLNVKVWVSEAAAGTSGTVTVAIKTGNTVSDSAITSAKTLATTSAIPQATLVAGYVIFNGTIDEEADRYIQIDVTGGGTSLSGGAIFAEVTYIEC